MLALCHYSFILFKLVGEMHRVRLQFPCELKLYADLTEQRTVLLLRNVITML